MCSMLQLYGESCFCPASLRDSLRPLDVHAIRTSVLCAIRDEDGVFLLRVRFPGHGSKSRLGCAPVYAPGSALESPALSEDIGKADRGNREESSRIAKQHQDHPRRCSRRFPLDRSTPFACRRGGNPLGQAFANFSGWHSAARFGVLQAFINGSKRLLIFGFQVFVRSEVRTLQLKLAPGFSHAQSILPQSTGAFSIGRSAHGFATCCWPPAGTCAASRYGSSGITIHAMI